MDQQPDIVDLPPKLLVGICATMSRVQDGTQALWQEFMPRRGEIGHRANGDFVSLQVYPQGPGQIADPNASFTKWALAEVKRIDHLPAGMRRFDLAGGLYACFTHHGPATDTSTVEYIFTRWLPAAGYKLANREHFELLPEGYKPLDPNATEQFWIPVTPLTKLPTLDQQ